MTYTEYLERKARTYWAVGQRLPLDLFSEMLSAGLDVDALERQYEKESA